MSTTPKEEELCGQERPQQREDSGDVGRKRLGGCPVHPYGSQSRLNRRREHSDAIRQFPEL